MNRIWPISRSPINRDTPSTKISAPSTIALPRSVFFVLGRILKCMMKSSVRRWRQNACVVQGRGWHSIETNLREYRIETKILDGDRYLGDWLHAIGARRGPRHAYIHVGRGEAGYDRTGARGRRWITVNHHVADLG